MMINNVMNELIGRKFKRNKYGLSNWTETIRNVRLFCIYEKVDGIWISKPEIMVSKSEPTYKIGFRNDWYFLNEIVHFLNSKISFSLTKCNGLYLAPSIKK